MIRLLLALIVMIVLLTLVFRERLNSPTDELKIVGRCYAAVESAQRNHKARFGRYGNLADLLSAAPLLRSQCSENYLLDVTADENAFVIRIAPVRPPKDAMLHGISLYAGGDGNVRIKYGGEPADAATPVFPKFRQYLPN
jgi:hypothetical protein